MDRREQALELLKQGVAIPAMPLALDANRKLDERRQRALLRYYLECGAGGIAAAVHTTQFAIRQAGLFEPVLAIAEEEINRFENAHTKVIVRVAGVCGETAQAVREAEAAKRYGFDAVLLSPGGLHRFDENYLIERTRAVAEVLPVIGFYLQPSVGGRRLSYEYWAKIAEIPNVAAIKTAPFDRYMTLEVIRAVAGTNIALYTGNDDHIVADLLTKPFVGGLLGHWSVWTKRAVELFGAVKRRENVDALLQTANAVTDANAAFFDVANGFKGCIAGLHEVLRRQGLLDGIWCLDPNETLSPGQKAEIDRVYAAYPQLNDDEFVRENLEKWMA
jgi:dihydrodipicolinate synthase/N-acetylneuraminate lyase